MAPSDQNDFEEQVQDLDGMELVDRKIIAAAILVVDITEVYSLERVAKFAKRYGLVAGSPPSTLRRASTSPKNRIGSWPGGE